MSIKSKFQIAKKLDERINKISADLEGYEPEYAHVTKAYILGFHSGNTTNFVGLTTNYIQHHDGYPVVGVVYFKFSPSEPDIVKDLQSVVEFSNSSEGLGNFPSDKNNQLYLVYSYDKETGQCTKKVFDISLSKFLQEQPKLSILDDVKIFNHSAMIKLSLSIKIGIYEESDRLLDPPALEDCFDNIKKLFHKDAKDLKFHLNGSNYSTVSGDKSSTETLYDYLDAPDDINQMGDYLPQLSKSEKEKLVEKWRNKMKSQRSPLKFSLEHDNISFSGSDPLPAQTYGLEMDLFSHIHVNDSRSKTVQILLFLIRQKIELIKLALKDRPGSVLEPGELKSCSFKPAQMSHLVSSLYAIPSESPDLKKLTEARLDLHNSYLIPLDRPSFRFSQRVVELTDEKLNTAHLRNVHEGILDRSGIKGGSRSVVSGSYTYHHYMQDKINDNGWGCAYRSLQTIISWFIQQGYICSPDVEIRELKSDKTSDLRLKLHQESRVPTHEEIQSVLVDVGDKQASFIGSQKWIGSQEVCYVLSHLYNIDSKFISVSSGGELVYKARELGQHFESQSTPIMIGGGILAHTIIGVDFNEKNGDVSYLILDPHYTGGEDLAVIIKKGWCGWKKNAFWDKNAFYNLCLPQRPIEY